MPYRGWRFRAAEREDQLINLPPVLSVTTPESAADAARLGWGWPAYCIIRRWMACATGAPSAAGKRRAGSGAGPLLYTARDLAPLKLRKFIDFAAPALRQALLRIAGAA